MNAPSTAANRRRAGRRAPKALARVACQKGTLGLGPNLALCLLDASETRARLLLKAPLEKGQQVTLGIEGQGHLRPLQRVGTVVWSVPAADGTHCVGIRFDKPLGYTDLSRLT